MSPDPVRFLYASFFLLLLFPSAAAQTEPQPGFCSGTGRFFRCFFPSHLLRV